jgi:hypothetical protein
MKVHMPTSDDTGLAAIWDESYAGETCPTCGREVGPDPDGGLYIEGDATGVDFAHLVTIYVAGPRFVDWYEQQGHRGLEFVPIRGGDSVSRIRIVGSAQLSAESGVRLEEECSGCGFRRYSPVGQWLVDEGRWDGSGFFSVEEKPGPLLCTEEVRAGLELSDLRGIVFVDPRMVRV